MIGTGQRHSKPLIKGMPALALNLLRDKGLLRAGTPSPTIRRPTGRDVSTDHAVRRFPLIDEGPLNGMRVVGRPQDTRDLMWMAASVWRQVRIDGVVHRTQLANKAVVDKRRLHTGVDRLIDALPGLIFLDASRLWFTVKMNSWLEHKCATIVAVAGGSIRIADLFDGVSRAAHRLGKPLMEAAARPVALSLFSGFLTLQDTLEVRDDCVVAADPVDLHEALSVPEKAVIYHLWEHGPDTPRIDLLNVLISKGGRTREGAVAMLSTCGFLEPSSRGRWRLRGANGRQPPPRI